MLSTKLLAAFVALLASSDAFTITSSSGRETTALHASRRAFLDATLVVTAAVVGAQPAFADSDTDLSMPAEEEQRAADVSRSFISANKPLFSTIAKKRGTFSPMLALHNGGIRKSLPEKAECSSYVC